MPTYRTPDVYIEEISVFPPSVAEVETAIPAFVGYTANTTLITAGDLVNSPRRIKSLLEYEAYYGSKTFPSKQRKKKISTAQYALL